MNENKNTLELLDKNSLINAINEVRITYMEGSEVDNAFKKLELALALMPPITIRVPDMKDFDRVEDFLNDM